MLEKLPTIAQHAILLLAPPLLVFLAQDFVPYLRTVDPHTAEIVAAVVGLLSLLLTPLTKRYGTGSTAPATSPPAPVAATRGADPAA